MAQTSYGQQEPKWPKLNKAQENRKRMKSEKKSKNGDSHLLTQK